MLSLYIVLAAGDGTPGEFIHIADTSFSEVNPSAAFDPISGEYLIVYEREHMLDNVIWRRTLVIFTFYKAGNKPEKAEKWRAKLPKTKATIE